MLSVLLVNLDLTTLRFDLVGSIKGISVIAEASVFLSLDLAASSYGWKRASLMFTSSEANVSCDVTIIVICV